MLWTIHRKLLDYLVGATVASSLGLAAPSLARIPEEVFEEVLSETEESDWDAAERLELLRVLSVDERPRVRHAVAKVLALSPATTASAQDLLKTLAMDRVAAVRHAAAGALSATLGLLTPLERLELACDWAVAEQPELRLAVAQALAVPHPFPASDLVLSNLVNDRVHPVRAAALRSASTRFELDPAALRGIAELALHDSNRAVRTAARHAFRATFEMDAA